MQKGKIQAESEWKVKLEGHGNPGGIGPKTEDGADIFPQLGAAKYDWQAQNKVLLKIKMIDF